MKLHRNNSGNWYDRPDIQVDLTNSLDLYTRYRKMEMCEKCLKLDVQFEALFSLLMVFKKSKWNEIDTECASDLLHLAIPEERKDIVYQTITEIGFESIKNAFRTLIQICDNEWEESEDLFGILKKHRFKSLPELNANEQFLHITRYFNLTFIYLKMIKNRCEEGLSNNLIVKKTQAAYTLMPLIDSIFHSILGYNLQRVYVTEIADTIN